MRILYDLIYAVALVPLLLLRLLQRGRGSLALRERLGNVPSRPVSAHCVWIHGVSLGEINATRTLVAELRRRSPQTAIVLSSTTQTGLDQARRLYGAHHVVFRFPLDFSFVHGRVFNRIRPTVIVLMELEVWPNLLEVAAAQEVPVVIANGRVTSEKSLRRFNWPVVRAVARRMFRRIRWVGAQDAVYAARFVELGVPNDHVTVTGSLKYDAAEVGDRVDGQESLATEMGIHANGPLWVCGSTGPGEEPLILGAYARLLADHPDLQLAIIPRKPERFDEVAQLIVQRGYACLRRSTGRPLLPEGVDEPRPVFLGDTLGELRKFYGLATVVFVGRSLVPLGGSDVMEVAALGKAPLVGPHTENFAEAVSLLLAEGGCRRLVEAGALSTVVSDLLRHAERRAQMGAAARATVLRRRGATEQTVQRILEFLT